MEVEIQIKSVQWLDITNCSIYLLPNQPYDSLAFKLRKGADCFYF